MTTFTPPPSPSHGEVAIGGMSLFSFLRQLNERYEQQSTTYTSDACRQLQSDNFRRTEALIATLEQEHQHTDPSSPTPATTTPTPTMTPPSPPPESPDVPSSSGLSSLVQFFLDTNASTLSHVEESSHRVTQLQSSLDHRDNELERLRSTLSDCKSYSSLLEGQLFDKIREIGDCSEKLISLQARERERGVSNRMGEIQVKEAESRLTLCCVSAKEGMACLEKLLLSQQEDQQQQVEDEEDEEEFRHDRSRQRRRRRRRRGGTTTGAGAGAGSDSSSDEILADVYECLEKIRLVGEKKGQREEVINWDILEEENEEMGPSRDERIGYGNGPNGNDQFSGSSGSSGPLGMSQAPESILRTRPRSRTMNLRTALSHLREDLSRTKAEKVEIGAKIGSLFHAVESSKRQVSQLSEANEHLTKENEFLVDQLIRSRLQCKKTEGQLSGICKDISSYISESQDVVHHLNDENSNLLSELLTFRARDNQMAVQQQQQRIRGRVQGRKRRASVHVSPNRKDRSRRRDQSRQTTGKTPQRNGASPATSSRLRPTSARKGTRPRTFSRTLPTKRPARGKAGSLPRVQQKRKFGSPESAKNPLVAGRRKKDSGRFDVSITPRQPNSPKRTHSDKPPRRRRGSGVKPRRF